MLQSQALDIMNAGASVYLTGAPGAGKTYVLNQFITQARKNGKSVAVTASTGIAATHINGQTIHSFSGIGISTALTDAVMKRILTRRKKSLVNADVLVIDEVSMIHAWFFDLVDEVCRRARKNNEPFGGLQVVISGDFFQLPPVSVSSRNSDILGVSLETMQMQEKYALQGKNMEGFITESFAWDTLNPIVCYLTEQHRQDDGQLLSVLTSIREGNVSQGDYDTIAQRVTADYDDNDIITHLFPSNKQADTLNDLQLNRLTGPAHTFVATSAGSAQLVDRLKKTMLAPENLVLREGASVMALRNDPDKQYVNGSLGIVKSFTSASKGGWPIVEFDNGHIVTMKPADWEITDVETVLAVVSQVPLRCAWGITIHKSQGMTLHRAVMDLQRTFAPGMGYVAMSRVQGLDGLYLQGLNPRAFVVSQDAVLLDTQLRVNSDNAVAVLSKEDALAVRAMQKPINSVAEEDDEFSQGALF
ncbi:ATP-dependent endonuclease [Alloscardovia theropitheci]|uniref:ATP-dependent endonuclease n=1 Tax=Alloscardovia theropitheci TaxID=2496842 RepID=A0A4R0QRK3_9BIFI|nr:PIF1 family DEAD/DEAH box helicase [Alloscardovia theropitheci]TCD54994.1 ATP-dependent endonuclease [Alloscardovia theropitheci]